MKVSDVVIDNFRPGVLERLQIDYATLSRINPRIIQCSVTGFGTDGDYKDYPALDINIQAISGHMAITGEPGRPPVRVGIPLADMSGGIFSCKGSWRRCSTASAPARAAASSCRCSTACSACSATWARCG